MRISDWSSDVCSSDLAVTVDAGGAHAHTGTVQGTALTEAQLPVHSHLTVVSGIGNDTLTGSNSLSQERTAGGDTQYILNSAAGTPSIGQTSTTGSGQAHSHGLPVGAAAAHTHHASSDRQRVVWGKRVSVSVYLGGRRI